MDRSIEIGTSFIRIDTLTPCPSEKKGVHLYIIHIHVQLMILTKDVLNELSKKAKSCEMLRTHFDLRNSPEDQSQRMLNAMEPCTQVPIHRHPTTNEVVILLRGSVKELIYDNEGNITDETILKAGCEPNAMNIPAGTWHGLVCLEEGTILFEAKDGPFAPRNEEDIMKV